MKIEFQGAARTVTGSMHVLHANGYRILLDCGLFQGKRALADQVNRNFPFDPKSVDALVLSHAHIDHCGNIPNLVKHGFAGPVFCTPATLDLCAIMLADSGHIQEKDAEFLNKQLARKHEPPVVPLYTAEDATNAIKSFKTFGYEKEFEVLPGVRVTYYDAGHILGSASVKVTVTENGSKKILGFSGDVGRWNMPILKDPAAMGDVDALINESTYGGKMHDPPSDMEGELAADLKKTFDRGGKVIIPAFSVGRTQDLVYAMHKMWDRGELPQVPVYVDSPLAVNATDVFKKHPECFDAETWEHLNKHHDPFGFNRLTYIRTVEESKKLNDRKEPCVIISASGMCEAGRILHHLRNNITDPRNTILIVGYQAEYTLGKRLVDLAPEVKIFGEIVKRNAEVIVHNSFSAHADGAELIKYIGAFGKTRLGKIFLVHGELDRSTALKADLDSRGYKDVEIPSRGQTFDL